MCLENVLDKKQVCFSYLFCRLDFQPFEGVRFSGPPPNNGRGVREETQAHKTAGNRAYLFC